MRRSYSLSLLLTAGILLFISGCAPAGQAQTPSPQEIDSAVSATLTAVANSPTTETALEPVPVEVPQTSFEGTTITCGNFSVVIPFDIANGAMCEEIPEVYDPNQMNQETYSAYYRITLGGYYFGDHFFDPQIRVYPVARFQEILPDVFSPRLTRLQGLINGGQPEEGSLPFLPEIHAMQEFTAQYQPLSFINGSGVRFLTMFSQAFLPVNNYEMIYTFQGLTSDGQYWISAIMPVSLEGLPPDSSTAPGGDWNAFVDNFTTYIAETTAQINQASGDSFSPSLLSMDRLISSLQVIP